MALTPSYVASPTAPNLSRRGFLKAASAASVLTRTSLAQNRRPPNFVIILCDDLGFGDLGCYGSSIPTPNIDAMAAEGVRFDQFYSANAVCSPARAALMTGRYPTRVNVPNALGAQDPGGLATDETTIAEMLKPAGYKSMCVGKWHLGATSKFLPTSRGFDEYWGLPYSVDQSPSVLLQNGETIETPVDLDTLTQRYTEQAVRFVQRSAGSPFLLYMAHSFPHIPLAASAAFRGSTGMGLYADVVSELDWSVGQVLQALKDNSVDDNTLAIVTSDNGPWYLGSPGKLRGRKGSTYEGGYREPFIARFPGRIPSAGQAAGGNNPGLSRKRQALSASAVDGTIAPGRICTSMATMMDLVPTIASLANVRRPAKRLDGVNIWPVLSGAQADVAHEIFFYFDSWNLQCARLGPWKLHMSRYNSFPWSPDPPGGRMNLPINPELYNLEADPDESYDMASERPEIVADILARVNAALPTFPAEVRRAWAATAAIRAYAFSGALPVVLR